MNAGAVLDVAKKKGAGRPKSQAPEPSDSVRIKVTPAFKRWLQDFANDRLLTMTDTIIQALIEDAARRGFKAPPKG